MKTPARGRPRDPEIERRVLEKTLELIAERGVAAVSIDAIASAAGISKPTLYARWPSKDALFIEAIRSLQPDLPPPRVDDPRAEAEALLRHALRPRGSPAQRILPRLVGEASDDPELARVWRDAIVEPRRARLAEALRRAIALRQLRADLDVELGVDLLLGPIFYRRLVTGGPAAEQFAETLAEGFFAAHGVSGARRVPTVRTRSRRGPRRS